LKTGSNDLKISGRKVIFAKQPSKANGKNLNSVSKMSMFKLNQQSVINLKIAPRKTQGNSKGGKLLGSIVTAAAKGKEKILHHKWPKKNVAHKALSANQSLNTN